MSSLDDRHVALQGGGHLHLHLQHPPPPYTVALILSFDDISLLFLYFRYRIESTLAPRRPSLSSSATVFRSWRGNRLSRLCNSITYRSSDSLLDLSMMYRYIYIYTSVVAWIFARRRKAVRKKDLLRRKENGSQCPFVERRSNKNRTRIDNWN